MTVNAEEILSFWFDEIGSSRWFSREPAISDQITKRFLATYQAAERGELRKWEGNPEGMLGLLLLFGVFSRYLFPNQERAYENDDYAIDLARDAIIKHFDDRIDRTFKLFFYLPFMNSENEGNQRLAIFYIRERTKEDGWITMAEKSLDIILHFGRFPERNVALGRESTPEETAYLKEAPSNA